MADIKDLDKLNDKEARMSVKTDLSFHPEAPTLSFRAYGVDIEFCEDGEVIAAGHHTVQRFVAAANKVARTELGLVGLYDDYSASYAEVVKSVKQVWAIRLPKCDHPKELVSACDACRNGLHDCDPDPAEWRIRWDYDGEHFTAETPGVRPYMALSNLV